MLVVWPMGVNNRLRSLALGVQNETPLFLAVKVSFRVGLKVITTTTTKTPSCPFVK